MASGAFAKTFPQKCKDNRCDEIKYRIPPTCHYCPNDAIISYSTDGKRIHECTAHLNNPPQVMSEGRRLLAALGLN